MNSILNAYKYYYTRHKYWFEKPYWFHNKFISSKYQRKVNARQTKRKDKRAKIDTSFKLRLSHILNIIEKNEKDLSEFKFVF